MLQIITRSQKKVFKALFSIISYCLFCAPTDGQSLHQLADSFRRAAQIPELGYAVITKDSILQIDVLGYHRADLKNKYTEAKIDDYFHLGSNTKAITSFIAAYFVEKSKLSWDTKFFDLFPLWKSESDTGYYKITLEQLLSHQAKIQPYTSGLEFQELPRFTGTAHDQRLSFSKYLLKEKPVPASSKPYNYSNAGYTLAALMLEKATGNTWEELVNDMLSQRLHLSYKIGWPNLNDADQPWGHWIENDSLKALPANIDYNLKLIEPAGDISMPLPDYARFIQLNLQGLTGTNNILQSATYEFLHYGKKNYSLGWGNTLKNGDQLSTHAGSAGTFYCLTIINKTRKVAFVVIANSATENCQKALHMLVDKMSERSAK